MLSELQRAVLTFIVQEAHQAQQRLHNGKDIGDQINTAAGYAFALYTDLTIQGGSLQFSKTMLQIRGVNPSDPEFFRNLHALQDFVHLINQPA